MFTFLFLHLRYFYWWYFSTDMSNKYMQHNVYLFWKFIFWKVWIEIIKNFPRLFFLRKFHFISHLSRLVKICLVLTLRWIDVFKSLHFCNWDGWGKSNYSRSSTKLLFDIAITNFESSESEDKIWQKNILEKI